MMKPCWFVRGAKHAALAMVSYESLRTLSESPGAYAGLIVTDEKNPPWRSSIPESTLGMKVIEVSLPADTPIMRANLECQIEALWWELGESDLLFLDTDILAVSSPERSDIRWTDTSMAVTWRDHVGLDKEGNKIRGIAQIMPYNYGVIMVCPSPETIEAFIWMRERIRKMGPQLQRWYGNQIALAALAGPAPTDQDPIRVDQRPIPWMLTSYGRSLSIKKVPGEIFNYTPQGADEDISGKVLLHFKGPARKLMPHFAKRLGLRWPQILSDLPEQTEAA